MSGTNELFLEELADYLEGLGETGVVIGEAPPSPTAMVSLFEYGGRPPMGINTDPLAYERPRVQAQCRAGDYPDAKAAAHRIYRSLGSIRNVQLGSTFYLSVMPTGSPESLGQDTQKRHIVAVNFEAERRMA